MKVAARASATIFVLPSTVPTRCAQVIIGGRNKYLINGKNAQQSSVQNLFHSVQLNVNNPHFLIMQVRRCAATQRRDAIQRRRCRCRCRPAYPPTTLSPR